MPVRKTLLKRFKITRKGKVMRLSGGQNHFRGKKSRKLLRQKKKKVALSESETRLIKKILKNKP